MTLTKSHSLNSNKFNNNSIEVNRYINKPNDVIIEVQTNIPLRVEKVNTNNKQLFDFNFFNGFIIKESFYLFV